MITEIVIGIFIAAAREAAIWPRPNRHLAYEALCTLSPEYFEPEIQALFN